MSAAIYAITAITATHRCTAALSSLSGVSAPTAFSIQTVVMLRPFRTLVFATLLPDHDPNLHTHQALRRAIGGRCAAPPVILSSRLVIAVLTFGALAQPLPAQMRIARNVLSPYLVDSLPGTAFVLRTRSFIEGQRGFRSAGDEQAWNLKVATITDLFHIGTDFAVALDVGFELTANPHNSTHFNPRALFLEPALTVAYRLHGFELQGSVFHRCRHDVDNLDPPNDVAQPRDTTRYRREIVLGGGRVGVLSPSMRVGHAATARWWASAESYTVGLEERSLTVGTPYNSTKARGAVNLGGSATLEVATRTALYARGFTSLVSYKEGGGVRTGWRLEPGVRMRGSHGTVDLFAAAEHAFDDYSVRGPQSATMWSFGMRIGDHRFF